MDISVLRLNPLNPTMAMSPAASCALLYLGEKEQKKENRNRILVFVVFFHFEERLF